MARDEDQQSPNRWQNRVESRHSNAAITDSGSAYIQPLRRSWPPESQGPWRTHKGTRDLARHDSVSVSPVSWVQTASPRLQILAHRAQELSRQHTLARFGPRLRAFP